MLSRVSYGVSEAMALVTSSSLMLLCYEGPPNQPGVDAHCSVNRLRNGGLCRPRWITAVMCAALISDDRSRGPTSGCIGSWCGQAESRFQFSIRPSPKSQSAFSRIEPRAPSEICCLILHGFICLPACLPGRLINPQTEPPIVSTTEWSHLPRCQRPAASKQRLLASPHSGAGAAVCVCVCVRPSNDRQRGLFSAPIRI
ncbi:hypothetical protein LZ32DRAFT_207171 [Colletotrichum eremochloae]|nr:hypothetical protein LZ32DRAFT_207171 [Colletotrichum eremochloae]